MTLRLASARGVGPRDRLQTSVVGAAHPWNDRAITEAHDKLGTKFDAAPYAAHATNEMRAAHARRHEIGHDRNTIGGLDRGFENQRMATIIPRHFSAGVCRLDRPSPVVPCAEEIGETSGRIETWPAKPVSIDTYISALPSIAAGSGLGFRKLSSTRSPRLLID
jgi:hypothetical protein